MYDAPHTDLNILIKTLRPRSLLVIDPSQTVSLPAEAGPSRFIVSSHARILDDLQQPTLQFPADLGIVTHTLEFLDRKTAHLLLGRLRDWYTRRFVVVVPIGEWPPHHHEWLTQWQPADLLGFGMTLMNRYHHDLYTLHLYHYALATYKTTPEWFNSHHWAHPEHWKP